MAEFHLTEPGRLSLEVLGSSGGALYLLDIAGDGCAQRRGKNTGRAALPWQGETPEFVHHRSDGFVVVSN